MSYVHGYSQRESERLQDQSGILEQLLHQGTSYGDNSRVLEAGCGIGAQTQILARMNPGAKFISIDISEESLLQAREAVKNQNLRNVEFQQENILKTSFPDMTFDHIFVCFVLEHLESPLTALKEFKRLLKPGGSLTIIEGDHGSCVWHPETSESISAWNALIKVQRDLGHDPMIGRKLYPLLTQAGYRIEDVSPRWIYADYSNPKLLDGVVNHIIVPMVESAREQVLSSAILQENIYSH